MNELKFTDIELNAAALGRKPITPIYRLKRTFTPA